MKLAILLAGMMSIGMNACQEIPITEEHIQCLRCRHIITEQEDYQLVALYNFDQYVFPLCLTCAEDYNDMYGTMLAEFLEKETTQTVQTQPT